MLPSRKNIWPWGLTVWLVAFMAIQFHLVRLSAGGFEGPDGVDYYKDGLDYNREKLRQEAQRQLGWRLNPAILCSPKNVHVELNPRDREGRALQGELFVLMRQPATKRADKKIPLRFEAGRYKADIALEPGVWDLNFEFNCASFRFVQSRRVVVASL